MTGAPPFPARKALLNSQQDRTAVSTTALPSNCPSACAASEVRKNITRTENVSSGGVCFVTDKTYEVGEVILITCPFETGGHNIEVRGQVVRCRPMQGTGSKIYGICYER